LEDQYLKYLAPIGVSTYSRVNHLKRTIEALQKNTLAKESEIYIFSDAPQKGDEEMVAEVREYIHTIDGFTKVYIVERDTNSRIINNRSGIRKLVDKYGCMIFLEEDIVTAPGFLQFMNDALRYYENDQRILSISGYTPPINATEYCADDFFVLPRFNAWGFGIWKDRYETIISISKKEFSNFLRNRQDVIRFLAGGEDMLKLLLSDVEGRIDALDVKAMYRQYCNNQFTVYPRQSLVRNIGHDGTGVHCRKTTKFDVNLWDKTHFEFNRNIKLNATIMESNKQFRTLRFLGKMKKFIILFGLYPALKYAKDKE
jgi:hypothetical protein